MIDKEQYQRTFGVLHASALNLKEEPNMKSNHFPIRRALTLCAAVLLVLSLTAVCYGADVGASGEPSSSGFTATRPPL